MNKTKILVICEILHKICNIKEDERQNCIASFAVEIRDLYFDLFQKYDTFRKSPM